MGEWSKECHLQREKEGEGGMYEESNMETYTVICKLGRQWEFAI